MREDDAEQEFDFDEHAPFGGVYASEVDVWHSPREMTFDFLAHQVRPPSDSSGPSLVVARVRVPPNAMLGILQSLAWGLSRYEDQHGEPWQPRTERS